MEIFSFNDFKFSYKKNTNLCSTNQYVHDAFDYNDNNDNGNDGLWSIIGKWPPPPPPPDVCLTLNPLVTWHLPIVKNTLIMIITQILRIL